MKSSNSKQETIETNEKTKDRGETSGDTSGETNGDENVERGNWSGKLDFLLSLLGYAVGLGNVWRFPYLCYRNGGGAFLIPYAIMLVFVGMPLFYLEVALGQFSSSGPMTCWEFAPIFNGLGVAQTVVSALVSIYYNMIIGWSLFYLFASFIHITDLPWASCDNEWNTEFCYYRLPDTVCNESQLVQYSNGSCYNGSQMVGLWDAKHFENVTEKKRTMASEEYYNNRVLRLSSGIDEIGPVEWDLALSLLLAWVISFLCMVKGIKTTGKVVYFTALFPYLVLFILFFRGVTLPNAGDGIYFYLYPDFNRLKDAKVWNDAAIQIFFSVSNCWGGLIALSSYNRFHNNCLRDTILVTLSNCATSVFAGIVIFSFLGFMAGTMGTSVADVVDSGPGLAFIVYPDAVTRMPVSPLWAILFFLMLLTLGLDSEFAMLETVLTSILDQFPRLRVHKPKVILSLCIFLFLLGLPLCTHGGNYLLQLMDSYCSSWGLLLVGVIECVAIAWVYGCPRFMEDIRIMLGKRQSLWWRLCWQFFSPALILFILIFTWADYSPARYGSYSYPDWADGLGWLIALSSVIWIPVFAIYKVCQKREGTICERIRNLSRPTVYWGPALVKHRKLVDYVKGFDVDPRNVTMTTSTTLATSASSKETSMNHFQPSTESSVSESGISTGTTTVSSEQTLSAADLLRRSRSEESSLGADKSNDTIDSIV